MKIREYERIREKSETREPDRSSGFAPLWIFTCISVVLLIGATVWRSYIYDRIPSEILITYSSGASESSETSSASEAFGGTSDADAPQITEPIDINTASPATLMLLPGVGEKTARNIVYYRINNGRFKSVDELLNVSGIGPVTLEKIRPYVCVE